MTVPLEKAIASALELSLQEQAQLLEHLASHLANQVLQKSNTVEHWGAKVWAVLEQLDTSDWDKIDDPVAWLKEQRQQSQKMLDLDGEE